MNIQPEQRGRLLIDERRPGGRGRAARAGRALGGQPGVLRRARPGPVIWSVPAAAPTAPDITNNSLHANQQADPLQPPNRLTSAAPATAKVAPHLEDPRLDVK